MLILVGAWVAVAGGVAALAGLAGLHRVRRLRRDGVTAWALAVPGPEPAGQQPADPDRRLRLRYTLADGRMVERIGPAPPGQRWPAGPAQQVQPPGPDRCAELIPADGGHYFLEEAPQEILEEAPQEILATLTAFLAPYRESIWMSVVVVTALPVPEHRAGVIAAFEAAIGPPWRARSAAVSRAGPVPHPAANAQKGAL